ncbi:uroporphyrinogen-III C-methyltransferase [Oxalobacter vibrioformis]|uniref:Uroporphyrinogen-III C-methyltransferase n=1 Tax=Oxalobacter vibrioformis TaxID=933080 RepID=A0A9E9P260_9BURK|nr:uroporphyrinogen-III C-methyltransferase [Oxalobacter vibrioformis]WAW09539.1 uroporphyrinogen-III C-methyltransferase [Oxalobacter vibrioformis]
MRTPSPDEPAATVPPVRPSDSMPDPIRQQRRWLIVLAVVLCIVVAGLLAHFWLERQDTIRLREEMARRLQTGDTVSTEVKGIAKSMQDTVLNLQAKVAALENRQMESQSQHTSLEQMYRELAKNRDDRVLTDIEQILLMANQQLQLSSNVHGTLIALENADRLLAREDRPQFIGIRRSLAKDIERLRAVPYVDVTGMAVKLDVVIAQIKTLPLLSDAQIRPVPDAGKEMAALEKEAPAAKVDREAPKESWFSPLSKMWNRWTGEFWGEVKTLVHVRNVESPEALILSPTQAYFLRENLTLRLLGARVAMMARDHVSFSSDMKAAIKVVDTYFDPSSSQVQAVKTTLAQIMENNVAIELPSLSDSLTAVQNYRTKP